MQGLYDFIILPSFNVIDGSSSIDSLTRLYKSFKSWHLMVITSFSPALSTFSKAFLITSSSLSKPTNSSLAAFNLAILK